MLIEIGSNELARLKTKYVRVEKHCGGFVIIGKTHLYSTPDLLLAIPRDGCTITYHSGGRETDSVVISVSIDGNNLIFDLEPSPVRKRLRLVAAPNIDYPIDFSIDTLNFIWIYPDFPEETAIKAAVEDDNEEE